jgi:hypothetical protein
VAEKVPYIQDYSLFHLFFFNINIAVKGSPIQTGSDGTVSEALRMCSFPFPVPRPRRFRLL